MSDSTQATDTAPAGAAPRRRWGALVLALAMVAAMAFYAWTVMGVARSLTDYLLILPAAVIGGLAALWAGIGDIRLPAVPRRALSQEAKPIALLVMTVLYACAAPFLGFDIATALYIALALLLQGERSWWKIALAALPGAALTVWIFTDLLAVRMPVTLF